MSIFHEKTLIEYILPIKKISELALKEGNSKKPIYTIHKWWARRLSSVVRSLLIGIQLPADASEEQFWEMFYSNNELNITVLDPFMGGGTTLIESKKMGAKTIGIDIDPLACFITKKELETLDYDLEKELDCIDKAVGQEIKDMYLTEVEKESYPIINIFWVYELECPSCNNKVESHPHFNLYYNKKEQLVFCKHCGELHTVDIDIKSFVCDSCQGITEIISGSYNRGYCTCEECGDKFKFSTELSKKRSLRMFALEYEKNGKRYFKKADNIDLELFDKIKHKAANLLEKYYIPQEAISTENRKEPRPMSHGYHFYKDLFNYRQLLSLAILYDEIKKIEDPNLREWFIIAFSDSLASNNMLCNYAYGYKKLTPLFGIHAYTVPVRPVENNVWGSDTFGRGTFKKSVQKVIRAKNFCDNVYESQYKKGKHKKLFTGEKIKSKVTNDSGIFYRNEADSLILNDSSDNLDNIIDESVDLILTDPPYYDNLHYSELADFYYQWIKNEINHNNQEPIVNSLYVYDSTKEAHKIYEQKLTSIFKELYKKLKNDGFMIFSYHHNKKEAWEALGKAIKEANFVITNVLPIRSEGSSGYHTSENSIKWDSILVLRKQDFNNIEIVMNLEDLLEFWSNYIDREKLDLKNSDKLSFFRSLAVMVYTMEIDSNIENLVDLVNNI